MKNRSSNTPLLEDHFLECGCVFGTVFSNEKSFLEHTPTQEKLFFRFEFFVSAWLDCVWLGGVWLNFGGWLWVAGLLSLLGCVRWA
jgi:hypothetical protein